MRDHMSSDERLRRIGELLLRGVHLWSEAAEQARLSLTAGSPVCVNGAETTIHETANASTTESLPARHIAHVADRRRVRERRVVDSESSESPSETSINLE